MIVDDSVIEGDVRFDAVVKALNATLVVVDSSFVTYA